MRIPKKLQAKTEEGLLGDIPIQELDKVIHTHVDKYGMNLVNLAIFNGHLQTIPKHYLTQKLVLAKDVNKETGLHMACATNCLKDIPKELLTKENLSQTNSEGNSVYHFAADFGELQAIPPNLLTEDVILKENNYGTTVLDIAIRPNSAPKASTPDQSPLLLKAISTKTLKRLSNQISKDPLKAAIPKTKQKVLLSQKISEELVKRTLAQQTKEMPLSL